MSTCIRCGLEQGEWVEADKCSAHQDENHSCIIDCRNRELSNLRSLLRSQTRNVEMALEAINAPHFAEDIDREHVTNLLVSVLEALA